MITLTREEAQKILGALEYAYGNEMFVGMRVILRAKLNAHKLAQFNFQEYGPDNWGDSQVTKPEFVAEQKAKNEALRSMVQPKPEPVAYINVQERTLEWATPIKWETPTVAKMDKVPLYTAPPQHEYPDNFIDALKFHTAMQELEPEPMAYRARVDGMWFTAEKKEKLKHELNKAHINADIEPLYTAPPQREWQGLTDDEYEAMAEQYVTNCYFDTLKYAKAIEAKLKEKNT